VSNNEESKSDNFISPSEQKKPNQLDQVDQKKSDQLLNASSCISVPDSALQSQDASFLDSRMEHVSQLDNKLDISDMSN